MGRLPGDDGEAVKVEEENADVAAIVAGEVHDKDTERPSKRIKAHDAGEHSENAEDDDDDDDDELAHSSDVEDLLDLIDHCEADDPTSRIPAKTDGQDDGKTSDMIGGGMRTDLRQIGPQAFLEKYLAVQARSVRQVLFAMGIQLPPDLDEVEDLQLLSILRIYLSREFNKREKLPDVNTSEDVARLLQSCRNIIVITGAGISTSLGIPDFRSEDGIYSRLAKYQLADPQELFDITLFRQDPSIFYDFCRELLPEDRGYSPTHAFIRMLQDQGRLLRQYTQNIDDIESSAGIADDKLVQCHGSFKTATCLTCGLQVPGTSLFPAIKAGSIPQCPICTASSPNVASKASGTPPPTKRKRDSRRAPWEQDSSDEESREAESGLATLSSRGVMKPDITFFGEQLSTRFREQIVADRTRADLVLCIGTSLRVAPVAEIPNLVEKRVPQVFISREGPGRGYVFDVELAGACDAIVSDLAEKAGCRAEFDLIVHRGKVKH